MIKHMAPRDVSYVFLSKTTSGLNPNNNLLDRKIFPPIYLDEENIMQYNL